MPQVDLADDSFVVASPTTVAARLRDPEFWRSCWPDVDLTVYHDRGVEGLRWYTTGTLVGTAELWLEPYQEGTLVHVFLRADPAGPMSSRRLTRLRHRYAHALKAAVFALKDELEAGRPAGTPGASDLRTRRAAHRRAEPSRAGLAALLADLAPTMAPLHLVDAGTRGESTGATRSAGSAEPLKLVDVAALPGGLATAAHRLTVRQATGATQDLVLKRYLAGDDTAALEWERLAFARRCSVPTPEPVLLDPDGRWFGTPALVMTALPGAVLTGTIVRDARARSTTMSHCAGSPGAGSQGAEAPGAGANGAGSHAPGDAATWIRLLAETLAAIHGATGDVHGPRRRAPWGPEARFETSVTGPSGAGASSKEPSATWSGACPGMSSATWPGMLLRTSPETAPGTWSTRACPGVCMDAARTTAVEEAVRRLRDDAESGWPAERLGLCHGDFHPGNVLVDDGVVTGVVDWSAAWLGPAEADVATCRADLAVVLGEKAPDDFLGAYQEASDRSQTGRALTGLTLTGLGPWDVVAAATALCRVPEAAERYAELGAPLDTDTIRARLTAFLDAAARRMRSASPTTA